MVNIVRVSFPPLWQNIGTVLLLITNDRRVVTRLLHQTKQGILLLARKSRNFNTHAHLNTTVMMHFQSRFQYTNTGRMDKLRAPHFQSRFQYTIHARADKVHAAGTSILESGLKVHHYSFTLNACSNAHAY